MKGGHWRRPALGAVLLAAANAADAASFTGTFGDDKGLAFFKVVADGLAQNTLQSLGYGGGSLADSTGVPAGGFDPMLTLYDASGNLIPALEPLGYLNDDGPGGGPDSFFQDTLAVGTYWLALSLSFNFGNSYLGDGFGWDGLPSSTPSADTWGCSPAGSFMDFNCDSRTGDWALDILGFASVETQTLAQVRDAFPPTEPPPPPPLPEPGTLALFGLGLAGLLRKRVRCF
jgi:hypothetical protein